MILFASISLFSSSTNVQMNSVSTNNELLNYTPLLSLSNINNYNSLRGMGTKNPLQ